VRATLCGHTHEALAKDYNYQTVYCSGAGCCVENTGGCMVHVIDFVVDDKSFSMSRTTFVWDENQSEFVFFKRD
jgi:hypothetical protein